MALVKGQLVNNILGHPTAFGHETLTITDTAQGFTTSKLAPAAGGHATMALVSVEDKDISYTLDGTTATATVGHEVGEDNSFVVEGNDNIVAFSIIRAEGTNAKAKVTYFR